MINLDQGRLNFMPRRSAIPIYVASNGPLGQRVAGAAADGAITEACASVYEAQAYIDEVTASASQAGRDPKSIKKIARLNACVADEGHAARAAVRPLVARSMFIGGCASALTSYDLPSGILSVP